MTLIKMPGLSQSVDLSHSIYHLSHFSWAEATHNGERIPEDTMFSGEIVSAARITTNIIKIAKQLDIIRGRFGDKPITITSWYRPPAVNMAVGGVRSSQHLLGWAADIQVDGINPHMVAQILNDSWEGGLGDSSSFTHVDLRHQMGWASARWDYGNA